MSSAGKDVEQLEPYKSNPTSQGVFPPPRAGCSTFTGTTSDGNTSRNRLVREYIRDSPKSGATQMSVDWGMDKQLVAHLYNDT